MMMMIITLQCPLTTHDQRITLSSLRDRKMNCKTFTENTVSSCTKKNHKNRDVRLHYWNFPTSNPVCWYYAIWHQWKVQFLTQLWDTSEIKEKKKNDRFTGASRLLSLYQADEETVVSKYSSTLIPLLICRVWIPRYKQWLTVMTAHTKA